MKKIIILLFSMMFVAFVGCSKEDDNDSADNSSAVNGGGGTAPVSDIRVAEFDFSVLPDNIGEGTPVKEGMAYAFPEGYHYPSGCDKVFLQIEKQNDASEAACYLVRTDNDICLGMPKGNILSIGPTHGIKLLDLKFEVININTDIVPEDVSIVNAHPVEGGGEGVLYVEEPTSMVKISLKDAAALSVISVKKITVHYQQPNE